MNVSRDGILSCSVELIQPYWCITESDALGVYRMWSETVNNFGTEVFTPLILILSMHLEVGGSHTPDKSETEP
jgi:hypothetical protein